MKDRASIPLNVFDSGLSNSFNGTVVNGNAKIGKNSKI